MEYLRRLISAGSEKRPESHPEAAKPSEDVDENYVVFKNNEAIHSSPSQFCTDLLATLKRHRKDVIFWHNGVPFRLCVPEQEDWQNLSLTELAFVVANDDRLVLDKDFFVATFPNEADRNFQLSYYKGINIHPAQMFRRVAPMLGA